MAHNKNKIQQEDSIEVIFKKEVRNYPVVLSNLLLGSPLDYTLIERRFMYKVISLINRPNPGIAPDLSNEKISVLSVEIPRECLSEVGGKRNETRTIKTIMDLAERPIMQYVLKDGMLVFGSFRWLGGVMQAIGKKGYTVTVTPEFYMYAACVQDKFTYFDINAANLLKTKYSQKLYEICCMYTGKGTEDYRFYDPLENGMVYKKRVLKLSIDSFRFTFGLNRQFLPWPKREKDTDTFKYYSNIEQNILQPSCKELYGLYKEGVSHVWFDYHARREGAQGTVTDIDLFFYTTEFPKSLSPELNRPWQEGDEELNPYEREATAEERRNGCRTFKPVTDEYINYYFRNTDAAQNKDFATALAKNKKSIKKALSEANRQDTMLKTSDSSSAKHKQGQNGSQVDAKQFITYFNSMISRAGSNINHINSMGATRLAALQNVCNKYGKTVLVMVLDKACKSDFLNGRTGHKFCASIDWILKEENFEKILQGKYNNRQH